MRRTDKIFWVGFVLLTLGIISGYPGFNLLMILFCCLFSLWYFFMGFRLFNDISLKDTFNSTSFNNLGNQLPWAVIFGFTCSIAVLAMLFKVNYYPGLETMSKVGAGVTTLALITAFYQFRKTSKPVFRNALRRILPFFIANMLCLFPMPWFAQA